MQKILRFLPNKMANDMLCASTSRGTLKGSCHGDSGAPLVRRQWSPERQDNIYTLMGSVVGTIGKCGSTAFPTIYIRFRNCQILNFINDVTKITPRCQIYILWHVLNCNIMQINSCAVNNNIFKIYPYLHSMTNLYIAK